MMRDIEDGGFDNDAGLDVGYQYPLSDPTCVALFGHSEGGVLEPPPPDASARPVSDGRYTGEDVDIDAFLNSIGS